MLTRSVYCARRIKDPGVPCYIGSFILPSGTRISSIEVASMDQHLVNRGLLVVPTRCPAPIKRNCSD